MHTSRSLVFVGGLTLAFAARLRWMSVAVPFGVAGPADEAVEIGWKNSRIVTAVLGSILLLAGILVVGTAGTRTCVSGASLAAGAALAGIGCAKRDLYIGPAAGFVAAAKVGVCASLLGALPALVGALRRIPVRPVTQGHAPIGGLA